MSIETRWRETFKNHKATVLDLDEDTQILTWKAENTWENGVEFVFRKNHIFVYGDLWDAVFDCTWKPKWDYDWHRIYPDYFASKCSASEKDKYPWDNDVAKKNLKEHYRDSFYRLTDEQYEELFKRILEYNDEIYWNDSASEELSLPDEYRYLCDDVLKQMCVVFKVLSETDGYYEFAYTLQNKDSFEDFNHFWEWGYSSGEELSPWFEIYLLALKMAKEQLESMNK